MKSPPAPLRRHTPPISAPRARTISRIVRRPISVTSRIEPAAWLTTSNVCVSLKRCCVCSHSRAFQIATDAELASASTSRTSSAAKTRGSRVATGLAAGRGSHAGEREGAFVAHAPGVAHAIVGAEVVHDHGRAVIDDRADEAFADRDPDALGRRLQRGARLRVETEFVVLGV